MPIGDAAGMVGEPTLAEFLETLRSKALYTARPAEDVKPICDWKFRPQSEGLSRDVRQAAPGTGALR